MARSFDELRNKMTPEAREKSKLLAEEMKKEMALNELRLARQYSQETLAEVLQTSQANISKLEKRTDMYLSTLQNYIKAMGGELEIKAKFPEGEIVINQFHNLDKPFNDHF
ncbi:MAG: XRE family transcriptional regulator [Sphingobacteriia bacterium]|nr:XRE family transcriptional regulator [Sphingobacteriia bacterium]